MSNGALLLPVDQQKAGLNALLTITSGVCVQDIQITSHSTSFSVLSTSSHDVAGGGAQHGMADLPACRQPQAQMGSGGRTPVAGGVGQTSAVGVQGKAVPGNTLRCPGGQRR